MIKTHILILVFVFICKITVYGESLQHPDSATIYQLKQSGDSILRGSSDSVRTLYNQQFYSKMDSILKEPGSFTFSFDSVKTLAVLVSPDKRLRIYNWILPLQRGNLFQYHGFIQTLDKKTKKITTYPLTEKKWATDSAELLKLDAPHWYGALYYKILHHKYNKKDVYTLLGWHGKDVQSTRKVIDCITVTPTTIQFGAPVFKTGGKAKMRLIFEYNAQATMSLKAEEDNRIVFDHLSPSDTRPEAKGMFSLYGPDMSYDALEYEKGVWSLKKNIQPRNSRSESKKPVPLEKKLRITHSR